MAPRIPILVYHEILSAERAEVFEPPPDAPPLEVSVEDFRADMTRLHRAGWRTIPAAEAAALTLAGRHARRTFALTFDDAARDFGELAHPILRDLDFTATVFVVVGEIGKHAEWDGGTGIPLHDADELRDLVREGVTLGSHSYRHRVLPECSDTELWSSLQESRALLSELIGDDVTSIAWPYGAHDERCRRMALDVGYRLGFAVAGDGTLPDRVCKAVVPAARDRMAISRRDVHGPDTPLRRRLRMGPADGLFVTARKLRLLAKSR